MSTASRRQRRLGNLRHRLANPQDAYERCRMYPCTNRTTADRGEGLNRLYCRKHIEHYRRHGSYVKKSYGAGELRPYRVQAERWLVSHADAPAVRAALAGVRRLYASSGAPISAFRLSGRSPAERAKALWASLRQREVEPAHVVALWLAVQARLRDDPQPDRHEEYLHVQVAKLIHRMAGGTHKRWERERADGRVEVTCMDKHPVSRGRVLRIVGEQVSSACAGLSEAKQTSL